MPLLILLLLVGLSACATTTPSQTAAVAPPPPQDDMLRGTPLASLVEPSAPRPILLYEADLPSAIWEKMVEMDDEHAQRRFALQWAGIEAKVGEHLLEQEAKRRNCSVEALLCEEVESKVGTPSDEAIRDLWSTYRHVIQASYAAARNQLKQLWHDDRATQLRQALVDRLRAPTELKLALEVPRLSRHAVRVGNAPRRGAPDGRVTVVAFGDYECPYSAQARRLLQSLEDLYPDRLQVIYRDFVLPQHQRGQAAAQAAACAAEQGNAAFWAYYNLLFDNNQNLEAADLMRYAKRAELKLDDFSACLASDRPQRAVAQSHADAQAAQVTGTPALFINGMRVQGVLPLPLMQALVENESPG